MLGAAVVLMGAVISGSFSSLLVRSDLLKSTIWVWPGGGIGRMMCLLHALWCK